MTSDKSAKDAVSSVRHNTAILGMGFELRSGILWRSKTRSVNIGNFWDSRIIDMPIIISPNSITLVLDSFMFFTAAHFS
jgi:hypothetical protein